MFRNPTTSLTQSLQLDQVPIAADSSSPQIQCGRRILEQQIVEGAGPALRHLLCRRRTTSLLSPIHPDRLNTNSQFSESGPITFEIKVRRFVGR